jgi:hypothetical protein
MGHRRTIPLSLTTTGRGRQSRRAAGVALCLCAACAVMSLSGCALFAPRQFYADTYYAQDHVYQNSTLGFALMYAPGWVLWTDPKGMDRSRQAAAKALARQGAELIFAGQTSEGAHGTRGIVENLNKSPQDYLTAVKSANAKSIEKDLGTATFMAGDILTMKWEYQYRGLRFVEFLFQVRTYDVRIAFWSTPERYPEFLPAYEDIMATLNYRAAL